MLMPTLGSLITAKTLLRSLTAFGPAVEAETLTFEAEPPTELIPALRVIHTGLRAQIAGKLWYGCDGATGNVHELKPGARIPPGITLLSVEGDLRWDRIHPAARIDHPELFVVESEQQGKRNRRGARR